MNKLKMNLMPLNIRYYCKVAVLTFFMFGVYGLKVKAQTNYPDTINIPTIDTSEANAFVSDYFVTNVSQIYQPEINLNQLLGLDQLKVGTEYNATFSFINDKDYIIKIKTVVVSCTCSKITYPTTPLNPNQAVDINVKIFPTMEGSKSVTVTFPVIKVGTGTEKSILIFHKIFKLNYTAQAN